MNCDPFYSLIRQPCGLFLVVVAFSKFEYQAVTLANRKMEYNFVDDAGLSDQKLCLQYKTFDIVRSCLSSNFSMKIKLSGYR